MVESKPWYRSRAVWASLITSIIGVVTASGVVSAEQLQQFAAIGPDVAIGVATTVAGAVSLWGRCRASSKIGSRVSGNS